MIKIVNNGQSIADTDYWHSPAAKAGYAYLSINAGAARILLPEALERDIEAMSASTEVIISRGAWTDQGGRDALEIMFEDGSDAPYCLHLSIEQSDRRLPETSQGGGIVAAVWTRQGGEVLRRPARYRIVPTIPCLEPWSVQ